MLHPLGCTLPPPNHGHREPVAGPEIAMRETITCVYCTKNKPRPSRGEHIVLECLGGTSCIPDVCQSCNNDVLGPLDQEFSRNSPIVLHRLFNSGPKGEVQEPQFLEVPDVGGYIDCVVETGTFRVSTPHQFFLLDGKLTSYAPGDREKRLRDVLEYFEQVRDVPKRIRRSIRDIPEHSPARLVVHPKNSRWRFVLRARTEGDAQSLLRELVGWRRLLQPDVRQLTASVDASRVLLRLSTPINAVERCVAKMAFNFLAHHLGAEMALRPEFDPVRRYITGEEVDPVLEVEDPAGGEAGFTVDTRFVTPWHTNRKMDASSWILPDGHTLALHAYDRVVSCGVHLFGGAEHFRVSLGRVGPDARTGRPLPYFLFASTAPGTGDEFFDAMRRAERKGLLQRFVRRKPTDAEPHDG